MQDARIWKERLAARLKQRADLLGEISLPSLNGSNWQHTTTSSITRKNVVLRPLAANNNCNWKIFMSWGVNCNVIALCCHMLSMCVCVCVSLSLSPLVACDICHEPNLKNNLFVVYWVDALEPSCILGQHLLDLGMRIRLHPKIRCFFLMLVVGTYKKQFW